MDGNVRVGLTVGVCVLLVNLCAAGQARVIYVDDDASGANNGSSWAHAYRYLQDALADANAAPEGVEIRVAQGVYKPDRGAAVIPGDQEAMFRLPGGITLKGGYAGLVAPDPDARDIGLYITILSGDLADNDTAMGDRDMNALVEDPSRADNCITVLSVAGADTDVELEGLVVRGACVDPSYCPFGVLRCRGSGLSLTDDSVAMVRNCTFANNAPAGIFSERSTVTVSDCTFEGNRGGMRIAEGSVEITRCIFDRNSAFEGGGIYCGDVLSPGTLLRVEDCVFVGNSATSCFGCRYETGIGGAISSRDLLSGSTIRGCTFVENTADAGGGGVSLTNSVLGVPFPPLDVPPPGQEILISDCTFVKNRAGGRGGAIWQVSNAVQIENSIFSENHASSDGGALRNAGGSTRVVNSLLSGNSAEVHGGAISGYGATLLQWVYDFQFAVVLTNCTVTGNRAPVGRVIACDSSRSQDLDSVRVTNCIVTNDGNEIHNPDGTRITIAHTDWVGGIGSIDDPCGVTIWGTGNLEIDPLFADPGYWDPNGTPDDPNDDIWVEGDYHLKSQAGRWDPNNAGWVLDDVTSPCIDAGDPNTPVGDEPQPNGGRINMGAYGGTAEASKSYSGEPLSEIIVAGDINGDCKVDITDLMILVNHWHEDATQQ